ncbi:IS3 family transposase [Actinomadura sp. WAC 06369]|nr:IS3 family transposase [Actinomadura sp. WAC 06369]
MACRVLNVSTSGYYDWLGRPEPPRTLRNKELMKMIREIHADSRGSYGSPRVHAELTLGLGERVNRKRVERLMRHAGLQGVYRRRGRSNPVHQATEEDLVQRRFVVAGPDRLRLTDITEHPTEEGKLYCAAVMDAYSRRIIGWSIDSHQDTDLVVNALTMAATRRPVRPFCIPITARNTRPGLSGSACGMPGCSARWARSVTATTIR